MSRHSSLDLLHRASLLPLLAGLIAASGEASASAVSVPSDPCRSLSNLPRDQMLVHVPFEVVDGRIYVQAKVNGRADFRFAVDTGASGMARADASLSKALALSVAGQSGNSDGVQTVQADTVHIDAIELDHLRREGIQAITRDYQAKLAPNAAFSGILAREFFSDGLLIVDYPKRTLSFSHAYALERGQPQVLPYARAFRVPVWVGEHQFEGNLDTGANVAFVLPRALYDQVATGPLEDAGRGQLSNVSVETGKASVHGPFRVGQLVLADVEVRVSDKFPELLVGAHALKDAVLMIDQRSASVAVCKP
jgi:predicted aspartyl protease